MNKSRIIRTALASALILALTLTLAACGNKQAEQQGQSSDDKKFLIGFNTWGSGTPTFDVMGDEIAYTLGVFGMDGSRVSDDFTADKELQNIQNFISAGVDGITMQATAPPVLPQAAEACKTAKIPFVLGIFVGDDKDRAQISANNPYYLGAVGADLYQDGYLMGQAAAKGGHKTAVLVGGNVGDNHFEQRIAGFTKSFVEEGGGKILDIARCSSPAEGQEKANALLSANRDADCLYAMVGDYVPGSINAMDALSLKIPTYASNVGKESLDYIKDGRVVEGGAGNDLAAGIAVALLVNKLDGHPIVDENGKAPELKTIPFIVNKDNVDDFISIFFTEGSHPFTPEFLKTLLWRSNPDVSYKTFTDLMANGIKLDALLKAHKN